MEQLTWILLTYKVPPEPAARRVALWRKLKSVGAVYLQNGVCLLPETREHMRQLKMLENDAAEMGGETVLLVTKSLDQAQEDKVIARFKADRDDQYREFIGQCDVF
ncbi:Protein ChrB [Sulfitobacter pontiacus]|uniref:Protein ChrB n=1 Tax=Sulfitobacter pontiacus TaxID=60137 RepID=A0AAX3AAE1_9RHOB|nr:Chromate resistance protein ChrB [Sulfitobacter pontiacus]UOA23044.1 Protein ChrB [Sulfitobacter pontiacus]|tara:strand:- start:323 stop:640 length:318 start_codon:yes stop_codon:yes gene_type:complete